MSEIERRTSGTINAALENGLIVLFIDLISV
jgi:hypothetical protein